MSIAPFKALEDQAFSRPHHIAFIFGNEIWTYRRMLDETIRLARALVARGISQGDRIALHMSSGPELAVAYHACFRMGAIAVPINNRYKSAELKPLLERLSPALYIGVVDLYKFASLSEDRSLPVCARFLT